MIDNIHGIANTYDMTVNHVRKNLEGKKFGRLTVISQGGRRNSHVLWKCVCECGNTVHVVSQSLTTSVTRSCGCLKKDSSKARMTKHGMCGTTEYIAWKNMMIRCYQENGKFYNFYGGRGIKVFDRWHTADNFLKDMGLKPDPSLTLERKDSNKDYSPSNCMWGTWDQQVNNRRSNLVIEHNGKKQTAVQWERELGLPKHIISNRITKGKWSHAKALSTPVRPLPPSPPA